MARITINGLGIEYELLGDAGAPAVAITPGGRFSMEAPGVRELGQRLAEGGRRVLIWDRPNCGLSDIILEGDSEAAINGRTLAALIGELDLGPTALAAGSAGIRVSMIAAALAPELVSHLALWWISGGPLGLMSLAIFYYGDAAFQVAIHGMEGVANSASWADQMARNPKARETILSQDPERFIAAMQRWALGFAPPADSPLPGMKEEDFARLTMPTLILNNGRRDVFHTRETTERVHRLMPQSKLVEAPWGDNEFNERRRDVVDGSAPGLFVNWPDLAPMILDFVQN